MAELAEAVEIAPQAPGPALADATVHATGQTYIDRYPARPPEPEVSTGMELEGAAAATQRIRAALPALAGVEVELRAKLVSGDLTAEEGTEVRSRLEAVAAERASLVGELCALELQEDAAVEELLGQLAGIDTALSALDAEDAALRRRLTTGGLSPEDEAVCLERLAAAAAERAALIQQRQEILDALLGPEPLVGAEVKAALLARYSAGELDHRDEQLEPYQLEAGDPNARRVWHARAALTD